MSLQKIDSKQTFDMDALRKLIVSQNTTQPTDAEMYVFKKLCEDLGANPFLKDIHVVKYSQNSPASFIVGKDFFTKVARAQGATWESGIIVMRKGMDVEQKLIGTFMLETDELVGGWADIHTKDGLMPDTVLLTDFDTKKNLWVKMPGTMIQKCALVKALRNAYPDKFGGVYAAEEMDQATQFKDIDLVQTIDQMDKAIVEPQPEPKPKSKRRPKKAKPTPPKEDPNEAQNKIIGSLQNKIGKGLTAMLEQTPEPDPEDIWGLNEDQTETVIEDSDTMCLLHNEEWKPTKIGTHSHSIKDPDGVALTDGEYTRWCNMPRAEMSKRDFVSAVKFQGWDKDIVEHVLGSTISKWQEENNVDLENCGPVYTQLYLASTNQDGE